MIRLFVALLTMLSSVVFADPLPGAGLVGGCSSERVGLLQPRKDLIDSAVTYCDGGDAAVSRIVLKLTADQLRSADLFYAGYPNGGSVQIVVHFPEGETVYPATRERGETWRRFTVELPSSVTGEQIVEVALIDDSRDWTGWGGLAYAEKSLWEYPPKNYLIFLIKAISVGVLLLLPGLLIALDKRIKMPLAFLPIPGIAVLTIAGIGFWMLPQSGALALRFLLYGLYLVLLVRLGQLLVIRPDPGGPEREKTPHAGFVLWICGLTFAQACAFGINPLPVAQEYASSSTLPGRMIASPPDHAIPYQTAVYMYNRYNGLEFSEDYFGTWNIASRGPIVPLGINTLFHLYESSIGDPTLTNRAESWPVTDNGVDLSRIYGWMLNSSLVLGSFYLLSALGASRRWCRIAVAWIALSPVVLINTVFLWPKLLAVYFMLLSLGLITKRSYVAAGGMMALSWLSHPVGALMLPVVALYGIFLPDVNRYHWSPALWIKRSVYFGIGLACLVTPWLAYKTWLGYHDVLFAFVMAGGQGAVPAETITQWSSTRFSNFWISLSPSAFFYSNYMHQWLYGPVSEPLRWAVQSAKTLPGAVGTGVYLVAICALLAPGKIRAPISQLRIFILIFGFLLMVIFWGFSSDGLGRNSMEPISVTLMIYTTVSRCSALTRLPLLLWTVAAESLYVLFGGFYFAESFDNALVKVDALGLLGINVVIYGAILWIGVRPEQADA